MENYSNSLKIGHFNIFGRLIFNIKKYIKNI